ncbi:uncharacterized protein LOC142162141 [Nicotiana tabacum]|uniref:Uncharacterized protein LOC142162141 n=1 Tax=Nicotiana tabacum TaxID=4097 RepID=A0AC58RPC6_TOBAC
MVTDSMTKEQTFAYTHPLYLGPSNTPGIVLIPTKFTGSENYGLWSRTMKVALLGKRKLGSVNGTCTKKNCNSELHEQWETCNVIVLSWLMNTVSTELLSGISYATNAHLVLEVLRKRFDKVNRIRIFQLHRAINTLSQGTDSVSTYFMKLKSLWNEYDAMVPTPNSKDCGSYVAIKVVAVS